MIFDGAVRVGAKPIGYWGSGYIGDGDGNGRDLRGEADFTWMESAQSDLVARIREAHSYGLPTVLNLVHTFWHTWWTHTRDPEDAAIWWTLRADAHERWLALVEQLKPVWQHIPAVMHIEEPFHLVTERHNRLKPSAWIAQVEKHVMATQIRMVNRTIRAALPTKPILGVFSCVELISGHASEAPAGYDLGYGLVGFDAYADAGLTDAQYLQCYDRMRQLCPGIGVVLIPDAQMVASDTRAEKTTRIRRLLEFARSRPEIVAVAGYHWASIDGSVGARDLPWVRELYRAARAA